MTEILKSECPRRLTKDQMITILRAGATLCIDRRDAPELPELQEMEKDGLVTSEFRDNAEQQYSVLKFRWK